MESLCHVVFSSEDQQGSVLTSNAPDPTLTRGESFWARMKLTDEDVEKLRELLSCQSACWMVTDLGVGILYSAHAASLGVYIYIHLIEDPLAVRRLLYRRHMVAKCMRLSPPPLGGIKTHMHPVEEDEALYERLCCILDYISREDVLRMPSDRLLPLRVAENILQEVVRLTRCHIETSYPPMESGISSSPQESVLCTTPLAAVGLICYWTGVMDEISDGGKVFCELSPISWDDRRLQMVFKTLVLPESFEASRLRNRERLEEMHRMIRKSDALGIQSTLTLNRIKPESPDDRSDKSDFLELKATFRFKAPPAPMPAAELHSALQFLYDFTEDCDTNDI